MVLLSPILYKELSTLVLLSPILKFRNNIIYKEIDLEIKKLDMAETVLRLIKYHGKCERIIKQKGELPATSTQSNPGDLEKSLKELLMR